MAAALAALAAASLPWWWLLSVAPFPPKVVPVCEGKNLKLSLMLLWRCPTIQTNKQCLWTNLVQFSHCATQATAALAAASLPWWWLLSVAPFPPKVVPLREVTGGQLGKSWSFPAVTYDMSKHSTLLLVTIVVMEFLLSNLLEPQKVTQLWIVAGCLMHWRIIVPL